MERQHLVAELNVTPHHLRRTGERPGDNASERKSRTVVHKRRGQQQHFVGRRQGIGSRLNEREVVPLAGGRRDPDLAPVPKEPGDPIPIHLPVPPADDDNVWTIRNRIVIQVQSFQLNAAGRVRIVRDRLQEHEAIHQGGERIRLREGRTVAVAGQPQAARVFGMHGPILGAQEGRLADPCRGPQAIAGAAAVVHRQRQRAEQQENADHDQQFRQCEALA